MQDACSLVMLPGLGADDRLLEPQRHAFPDLVVPRWIPPRRFETLPEYAVRLAAEIPPAPRLVLGGVSLGGMVAYEMARHLRPAAVILVASCCRREGFRHFFPLWRWMASRTPAWALRCAKWSSPRTARWLIGTGPEVAKLVAMFRDADSEFMRWALGAIAQWDPLPLEDIPVRHIHGARDRLIPARNVRADETVADGGHLINVTHADRVNGFIRRVLQQLPD